MEIDDAGSSLIETWRDTQGVILIKASQQCNALPGSIFRLDARKQKISSDFFGCNDYGFGLCEAIEKSRSLGILPPRVIVYGIVGQDFSMLKKISPIMEKMQDKLFDQIRLEWLRMTSPQKRWAV